MDMPLYLQENEITEEKILSRMLSLVPVEVDKSEGSYAWDALAPVALELVLASMLAKDVLEKGFAQTSSSEYLTMRAAEHGVLRRAATKASGIVSFVGTLGTVIQAGTVLMTEGDENQTTPALQFVTTEAVTIGEEGKVNANIEAAEPGAGSNVPANTIVVMGTGQSGVQAVTNPEATSGGFAEEDDETLRARYLEYVRNPGTSGNVADYVHWTNEVPGVGAVHVLPLWNGPGTVKLVVLGIDRAAPNEELVAAVQAHIAPSAGGERLAPIGAAVTVEAAETLAVDIEATLLLDTVKTVSLAEIKEKFEAALSSYFYKTAFQLDAVRYARLGSILVEQEGVVDYVDFTINGGTANIPVAVHQVAALGTVTLHAK